MSLLSEKKINKYVKFDDFRDMKYYMMDLATGCKKHPSYRYHKKPNSKCNRCEILYNIVNTKRLSTEIFEFET